MIRSQETSYSAFPLLAFVAAAPHTAGMKPTAPWPRKTIEAKEL